MNLFDRNAISMTCGSGATFSRDRCYRYALWRSWGPAAPLAVIGLNPSTADETRDDPTIRRCLAYAKAWNHGGLVMLNLFAFRATDPKELRSVHLLDPVGTENDRHLDVLTKDRRVLLAWGADAFATRRAFTVADRLKTLGRDLVCLGRNRDGSPKHPLYQRADLLPATFA